MTAQEIIDEAYYTRLRRDREAEPIIQSYFKYEMKAAKKPSRNWLDDFMKRNGLKLLKERRLEQDRSANSDLASNKKLLDEVWKEAIEGVDTMFLFNFDEIMVDISSRRLLVGARNIKRTAFSTVDQNLDHITIIPTISASGASCPDFVIVPRNNLQSLPLFLEAFPEATIIGPSGWINSDIFAIFIQQLIQYVQEKKRNKITREK